MCCGGLIACYPHLTPPTYRQLRDLAIEYGASFDDWVVQYYDDNDRQQTWMPTPLHALAAYSEFDGSSIKEEIQYLLSKGFDIDTRGRSGMTPLLVGLKHGYVNTDLVQGLLEAGADPLMTDDFGCGALHLFAEQLDCLKSTWQYISFFDFQSISKMLKILLRKGCNPNHVNRKGVTVSMRMRHAASTRVGHAWRFVLEDLNILDSVDLREMDESVGTTASVELKMS